MEIRTRLIQSRRDLEDLMILQIFRPKAPETQEEGTTRRQTPRRKTKPTRKTDNMRIKRTGIRCRTSVATISEGRFLPNALVNVGDKDPLQWHGVRPKSG